MEIKMSLQDQIATDKQAVDVAKANLEQAFAQLQADQIKLDAITPHLSLLSQIEEKIQGIDESIKQSVTSLVEEMRNLISKV